MSCIPARRRLLRRRLIPGVLAVVAAAVTACSAGAGGASPHASTTALRGDQLPKPITLTAAAASATFHTTAGGTTSLSRLQSGKLLLLYFGYTHCPDVCPTTMADLGQALRQLPSITQAHTQVVFVTSDPARDSTAVMKTWLANFDAGLVMPFIGLTSNLRQIDTVATSVGVPLQPPVTEPNGTISVEHGAQTLAFVNGKARVLWLAGTSVGDYAHDISTLVNQVSTP